MTLRHTPAWHGQITRLYVEGLGIEDIAARMKEPAEVIRREMDERELDGRFAQMEKRRIDRWRKKWGMG